MPDELQQKATEFKADLEKKLQLRTIDKERTTNVLAAFQNSWQAIVDDTTLDDAARAKKLDETKKSFDQMIERMPSSAGATEALRETGDTFVRGVESVAAGKESAEEDEDNEEDSESAEDVVAAQREAERAKRTEEFAKAQKKRDLKGQLRAASRESLTVQKAKYEQLKTAGLNRRNGLLDDINDAKKTAVKKQLEVYEKNGIKLDNPPAEYAQDIKALQAQLDAMEGKGSAEEPNMLQLVAEMTKAREVMESNKPVVLDEPPSFENVSKNFNKVNEAQASIQQAAAFLQASFAEAGKVVARGKAAAGNYDIFDKLLPWDTDNNDKVNAANEALADVQKSIRKEYNPLISDMDTYKATVLAAATGLQEQAKSLHGSKGAKIKEMLQMKKEAIDKKREHAAQTAEEQKDFFNLNVETLKKEHEAKLKQIREKKKQVMEMQDGQTAFIGDQKAILDENGQKLDEQRLTHTQAREGLDATIDALRDKLREPNLSEEKKTILEERLRVVEGKKGEMEGSQAAFIQRAQDLAKMSGNLTVAGENVYEKSWNALNNLDNTENLLILDFAQQMSGMERKFSQNQRLNGIKVEAEVDVLSTTFDDRVEVGVEEEKMAADLSDEADLHHLELEVANAAALDNVKSQCDQLSNQGEVGTSLIDVAWNTITLKRAFTFAYDFFGLSENNWFRKHVNGLDAPLTLAVDGIETAAKWVDEKVGISDWYHKTIEWAKDIKMPVLSQVAEVVAGVTDFAVDLGAGVTQLVLHPVESVKGIVDLAISPSKWKEVAKALIEFDEFKKGNGFFAATKVLGNVLLTATGVGAVGAGVKAGATATNVLGKVGRFARVAVVDFVKNAPRAIFDTGKFLVKTPFKLVSSGVKITVAAARGTLPETLSTMKVASRSAKILALDGQNGRFARQLGKIDPALDQARIDAVLAANGGDLAAATTAMETGVTFASDASKAYAKVVFARYFENAQRLRTLTAIDDAVNIVKTAKTATVISDAVFSLEKVSFDDYAKLAKRYKNVDDLAVAILTDSRLGLDVKNVAHVKQAKAMAKMLSEADGVGLKRYLKVLTEPVPVDDLIAHYGTRPEATNLGKIKAETAVLPTASDAKFASRMPKYRSGVEYINVNSAEDLMMKILEDWDKTDPIKKAAKKPKKGAATPPPTLVSHFDNPNSIKLARGYAEELLAERRVILPTDPAKLTALTASVKDVNLLEALSAAPAAKPGMLHWGENARIQWMREVEALRRSKATLGSAVDRARVESDIFWKEARIMAAWPVDKLGSMSASLLSARLPNLITVPLRYAFSAPLGAFVFTVDSTSAFGRELLDVIKANRAANAPIKAANAALRTSGAAGPLLPEVGLLNGAGEIQFIAKNAAELEYALLKLAVLTPNAEDANKKLASENAKKAAAKKTPGEEGAEEILQQYKQQE